MKRRQMGALGAMLSALVLSLELFGLKLVQTGEMASGAWYPNPLSYLAEEPVCGLAVAVTGLVFCISVIFMVCRDQ